MDLNRRDCVEEGDSNSADYLEDDDFEADSGPDTINGLPDFRY